MGNFQFRLLVSSSFACTLAACSFSPNVPNGHITCMVPSDCPPGYICDVVPAPEVGVWPVVKVCCKGNNCGASLPADLVGTLFTTNGSAGGSPGSDVARADDGNGNPDTAGNTHADSSLTEVSIDAPQKSPPDAPDVANAARDVSQAGAGGGTGAGGATSAGVATSGGGSTGTGGATGAGGMTNAGGALSLGGVTISGGTTGFGGATSAGGTTHSGGATSSGGASRAGGATSLGGTISSGGTTSAGGTLVTGGATILGGSVNSGGTTSGGGTLSTGGATSLGGAAATGGTIGTGGTNSSGGVTSTGGTTSTGGATTVVGSIPPGYPAPAPLSTYAACSSVSLAANGLCPGGGAGPACIECLFGGSIYNTTMVPTADASSEAGNYAVTVTLGGVNAGQTQITAESNRGLLPLVSTNPGQLLEYAFVVNVRPVEGQPAGSNAQGGYPGLDLFFSGPTAMPPQVSAIGYAPVAATTKPIMVYIASDSTACDETDVVLGGWGWGQMLPEFFGPPVGIANYANNGASSSSFYAITNLWGAITAQWAPGDWVIIQFGHNDISVSDATVQANLTKYVNAALAAGVTPILVSPPARAQFVGSVLADQSLKLHPGAAQAAANATGVAFIDLFALSTAWYNQLGPTGWQAYHATSGLAADPTFTNLAGAEKLAALVANAIKAQSLNLAKYLR